ncbi:CAP domain-containing protein [Polyangium sp. 6x1]|uniref:CAP domain-containing protein n=1 Tax=Polyangium sp. 6x1 TaxID=3042689 RepID=UPI0024829960|nr:CAP domain-containing protein [Polyangium sp. 6x1]MDI1443824.1 CAP domain-containing protein [Polyangium sp. 6x1]
MKNITLSLLLVMGSLTLFGCGGSIEAEDQYADETTDEIGEALGEGLETTADEDADAFAPEADTADLVAWCDDVVTWDQGWSDYEAQVLTLVNQKRAAGASCGGVAYPPAPALTLDERLRCAARKHSKDMGVKNFFSHTGSNGSTPWQRIKSAGYTYTNAAENIAAGYSTPSAVVSGWMSSTGHCKNIMNAKLKQIGIGYYVGTIGYKKYWTQDFGTP